MNCLNYEEYPREPVLVPHLAVSFMKQARFVPLEMGENVLRIAMADPEDFYTIDALKLAYKIKIDVCQGREHDIFDAIDRLYGSGTQSIEMIIEEAGKGMSEIASDQDNDVAHLKDLAAEAPIIRLVNRVIGDAVGARASDIHFEPFETVFKIRYRIDGVLHEVENPPKRLQGAILSRVKIMAKMDIAERRLPQDGRIKLRISDREIDFRISTIPTLFGESLVMRILDRTTLVLDFKKLGFPQDVLSDYTDLISQPYGMIMVTGPTGSGKTSTLYTTLGKINSPERKIITIEDPVEYQLQGVNQIQVKPKIGLSFAKGLRSIVRQDPDIILVGEIRDMETAEIAVQSALTGHLIFSTLHTNDAPGAITRLLEMGVEHYLLTSSLLGVLAQRLVRVICPSCKEPIATDDKLLASMGEAAAEMEQVTFFAGRGCEECRFTGFLGRTGIFELLPVDEDIRAEITAKSSAEKIKKVAIQKGMITLRQDGWRKVKEGITTVGEVLRVTLER